MEYNNKINYNCFNFNKIIPTPTYQEPQPFLGSYKTIDYKDMSPKSAGSSYTFG